MATPPRIAEEDLDVFWKPESWDIHVPENGFIHDFVLATRGIETPTKVSMWTAIFLLSTAMKRESYIEWYPSRVYPNFYIVIVGPPRVIAKSTAVGFADNKVLVKYHEQYKDPLQSKVKEINIRRNRITPEALAEALKPREGSVIIGRRPVPYDQGSQLALIISELGTFLGKQKYNIGLIDRLTHLYDCKDFDDEQTIGRGYQKFRNVYVTLFGATTRDGLENSIPPEAFGSGFMSRLVLVYQDTPTRSFPIPEEVKRHDGVSINWPLELQKRLAWVAHKSMGPFELSEEARDAYVEWYHTYKKSLLKLESKRVLLQTRYDQHLLKLMMILRGQSYEEDGNVIQIDEFERAKAILDGTYDDNVDSIVNVDADPLTKFYNRIVHLLQRHGRMRRPRLLQSMSSYRCYAAHVDAIIRQLVQEGKVDIFDEEGRKRDVPSSSGKESYAWRIQRRYNVVTQAKDEGSEGEAVGVVSGAQDYREDGEGPEVGQENSEQAVEGNRSDPETWEKEGLEAGQLAKA